MAGRALWKGVIGFGMFNVPVKLYTAVREERVSFNLLHEPDHARLNQRMICPVDGEEVGKDERVKGIELDDGRYAVFTSEELAAIEPEPSRRIEVIEFVKSGNLDARFYERTYYLGPDGDPVRYNTLRRGLINTGRVGVCRWVMRKKSYLGALRLSGEALSLSSMRWAEEVIPASTLDIPEAQLDDRELKMAGYLIETLLAEWDPSRYRNEYQDRLRELIEAKAAGKVIPLKKPKAAAATKPDRLLETLEASVKAAKSRKADGKKKTGTR